MSIIVLSNLFLNDITYHLKVRMVRSEVVEAPLYGWATWTSLKGHYVKLRTTHHRMLL